jgi:sulfur carrier protein ThiS
MVVTVRYVFGLACRPDGGSEMRLELPGGATVFQAMQRLGVSGLEVHAAVNGASAPDGTVLRDGDEVTFIPAIQGGGGDIP